MSTIVQFHGNAENLSSHFTSLAWPIKFGHQIFVFDYRGYGRSQGIPYPEGLYDDSLKALDYALELHRKTKAKKFIVYGQSLGGVLALKAILDWPKKDLIDLVVIDSSFCSYQNIAFKKLTEFWLTFLLSPLAYVLVSDEYSVCKDIEKLSPIPLLVIHGNKDQIVPLKFGQEIYDKAKDPKWFWQVEEGQHIQTFFVDKNKYRKKFLNFLETMND